MKILILCIVIILFFAGLAFAYSKITDTPINISKLKEIELKMPTFKKKI